MVVVSVRDGDVWQGDTSLSPQGLPGLHHNGDNHFVGKISRKATKPLEGFLAVLLLGLVFAKNSNS